MSNKGIGAAKPRKGNSDSAKLEEVVDLFKFQDHPDTWVRVRLLERGILAVRRHWCKIAAGKTKKLVSVPRFCISFNPDNESEPRDGVTCPYCSADTGDRETSPVTSEFFYLMNAIVRDIQEEEPSRKAPLSTAEKKTGFKDVKSKSWTPVRVVRLTNGVVARVQELGETNLVKNPKDKTKKKAFDLSHPKFGVDINIKFKPKAAGAEKYSVDKADDGRCALTEEEQGYLVYNLEESILDACGRLDPKQAKEDFKRMELVGSEEVDDEDDDDDDEIPLGKKGKKGKKKKPAFNDDDDDEEDDSDSDDDDEDEPPKKKKKADKSSGKKKKSSRSDDDDDEDEPPKKKKKKPVDEDDDDEPPKKKKKAGKKESLSSKPKKKKPVDDDEDDDEDDEPPKKKKKAGKEEKSSKKSSKKKSKFDADDDGW